MLVVFSEVVCMVCSMLLIVLLCCVWNRQAEIKMKQEGNWPSKPMPVSKISIASMLKYWYAELTATKDHYIDANDWWLTGRKELAQQLQRLSPCAPDPLQTRQRMPPCQCCTHNPIGKNCAKPPRTMSTAVPRLTKRLDSRLAGSRYDELRKHVQGVGEVHGDV